MSDDRPKRETMSIEEATISNMWEIVAIVEVLERKGLCSKTRPVRHHRRVSSQESPCQDF
ncbi:MAG: hypothetical protein ABIU05_02645 [Nitrospirales bacterium]